jgi:ABC-2 type transport system permease protein
VNSVRVFFVGGYLAYRALFTWLRPSIYIPTMLGGPIFQILFFAYVGRFARVQNDEFFVIGNAVQASALAGIFGMAMTIGGERWTQTLSPLLATPAHRIPLFLGRALPLIANGFIVSAFGFAVGWALLDFELAAAEIAPIALVVAVCSFSCTALGMLTGSIGLRARDVFFLANLVALLLLLFCGVNVPLDSLPSWMQTVGSGMPLTHGIEAAREIAAGAAFSDVTDLIATEAAIGIAYAFIAYALFRFFEVEGRRRATLETM